MANIDLTGADGSITYTTLVSGTNAPTVTNIVIVSGSIYKRTAVTTRPNSLVARKTQGEWNGEGILRTIATDDATPPLITTTQGTLNVVLKGSQKYAIPVVLTRMSGLGYTSLQGETPQAITYHWEVSATSAATNITLT